MTDLRRRVYGVVVRLHPAAFRDEFGREMELDFEDALRDRGFAPLLGDAVLSLLRQWTGIVLPVGEVEQPVPSHPFLAGQYFMVDQGRLTAFDLVCASALSVLLFLAVGFAANTPNNRITTSLPPVPASHAGGIESPGNSPPIATGNEGRQYAIGSRGGLPEAGDGGAPFHGRLRLGYSSPTSGPGLRRAKGGPEATISLANAVRQFATISVIIWLTSLFLRRSPGVGRKVVLAVLGLLGIAASVAFASVPMPPVHAQILHATGPLPSFEVATVKPWDGTGFGYPMRSYILGAFNLSSSAVTRLIGPEWINKTSYVIQGKAPDSIRDAMQKMTPEERGHETRLMEQSLLADRFKLKVHFETREMPVFEMVIAKGGSKLKEDPGGGGAVLRNKGQTAELKGTAMPLKGLISLLMGNADIDGRTVIDKTGLTGAYDLLLDWVPSRLAAPVGPGSLIQPGTYGPAPAADVEGPSLFTALEEQLGLKLVPAKAPVEVVVIDHIELPSEN